MKYDFDEIVSRENSQSMKWDVPQNQLPMWVADMDFKCAPAIRKAFQERLDQGVYGYTLIEQPWYDAYINWWKNRHHFEIQQPWLMFCTGVVPAISSIVRKLTTPNENVVIQTPVYNIFFNSIINNGARVLENPLRFDGKQYQMDFTDLEAKLADPQTTLMILCNPHNPIGKIWSKQELAHVGYLAKKYHVVVIADEIHCDLTDPGYEYVPFCSVDENCRSVAISCVAPTKAFNIAGIQTAAIFVPDEYLRHKVNRAINTDEVAEPNILAAVAPIAAFDESGDWLDQLRAYLFQNKELVRDFIRTNLPQVTVLDSQATYLLWIDVSKVCQDGTRLKDYLVEKVGLVLSEGEEYGLVGKHFLRMNTATCRARIEDGLDRLKRGIELFQEENR